MRHIASGRHGSVFALPSAAESGWSAVKIVHGPVGGRSNGSKPHDAVQEARVLEELDHPNIVKSLGYEYDIDLHEHRLKLPFLPISLSDILDRKLNPDLIRSIIFQSILGIAHMHDQGVAHRDINPRNIMIDWDCTVKIIDFGSAWTGGDKDEDEGKVWYETEEDMICDVGTGRWRAPELLFSPTIYDPFALDLWGIGVVITDMFRPIPLSDSDEEDDDVDVDPLEEVIRPPARTTLFDDGFGDIGLAGSIFRVLGTPTQETWPEEFELLPDAGKIDFITCTPQPLGSIFPTMEKDLVDLTTALIQLSPSRRISARNALEHIYFDDTLVPSKDNAWYGNPRIDLSCRCVEAKDGSRLIDHLADVLEEKREMWAP